MKNTNSNDTAAKGENFKILLVDDEPIILKMLGQWMENLGYAFATATNGVEAVEALRKHAFDIVFTDINMPRMDGMQLLRHIKQYSPQTDVIVITGYATEYNAAEAMEAGALHFLLKPFLAKDLYAALNRVRDNRRVNHQLPKNGSCASRSGKEVKVSELTR